MKRFSSFSKSAFWSQFLLGIVAIFALPAVYPVENAAEKGGAYQQVLTLSDISVVKKSEIEQPLFLQQTEFTLSPIVPQAVSFCEFFCKMLPLAKCCKPADSGRSCNLISQQFYLLFSPLFPKVKWRRNFYF